MQTTSERDILMYRPLLFSIAYNMLGSFMDAEDVVQDTLTNWYHTNQSHVENPKYYLIRAVSNRCINHLKKMKRHRESYVGTWLPEPLVEKQKTDKQATQFDNRTELSIGFLYLLERLNPLERAVLILKESFDFSYPEISRIFDLSQDHCRQLLSRARGKLKQEKYRFNVDKKKHDKILERFLQACVSGNMEELVFLLKEDIAVYADGGGKVPTRLRPLYGRNKVLKYIAGIVKLAGLLESVEIALVNGLSGAIVYSDKNGRVPYLLIALDVEEDEKIQNFYFIRNPDKLQHIVKE